MSGAIDEAAAGWLAATPEERARVGPDRIGTCAAALGVLTGRLRGLGYPVEPMITPCAGVDRVVAELEEVGPPVPPALVEVWRQIGQISLVDLGGFRHMGFWEQRLGGDARVFACDGVVVDGDGADEGWIGYVVDSLYDRVESGDGPAIVISPDELHKDNTSGGGPYELVPDDEDPWMARLEGFAWVGPARPSSAPEGSAPDLVSYLRTAILECGGFPGLFGIDAYEPIRLELTAGLPIF